jgi:hypothetical protein
MAIELPYEATATAVGVLIYSFIALFLNGLVVWLTWVHQERISCGYCQVVRNSPEY